MELIFRPVAQNTIIRPIAQAVCMMNGGQNTKYVDPTDKKEKVIVDSDVAYLSLEARINGHKVPMYGYDVVFHTSHFPDQSYIKAEINDVFVYIRRSTTVEAAMKQFRKKITRHNERLMRDSSRQREA